jgi:hypothetical protein
MAVASVTLSSIGASGVAVGTSDSVVREVYTATYRVECSDQLDGPQIVLAHFKRTPDLPWFGSRYEFGNDRSNLSRCATINVRHVDKSIGRFEVDVTYDPIDTSSEEPKPESGTNDNGEETANPLEWRYNIGASNYTITMPIEDAIFRRAINAVRRSEVLKPDARIALMNSAGVPFDPSAEEEVDIQVYRIAFYAARFDAALQNLFNGRVNSDDFTIDLPQYNFRKSFFPFTARARFEQELENINGQAVWRRQMELHVHPISWRRQFVDRGMHQLFRPGDTLPDGTSLSADSFDAAKPWDTAAILDGEGSRVTEPLLLDGNGKLLDPTKPPVFLEYTTKTERPFAGLKGRAW